MKRIIVFLALISLAAGQVVIARHKPAAGGGSPITVVSGPATANNGTGSTTLNLTLNSITANNTLVLAGNIYGASTCTDFTAANTTGTGTVTRLGVSGVVTSAMGQSAIWTVEGASAGNHTVQLSGASCGANVYIAGVIIQINNVPTSGVADQFNSATGASGTSFSAGSITTTTNNFFGIAICGTTQSQTWTRGSGWTNDGNADGGGFIRYEYRIGTTSATITGDFAGTVNSGWTCAVGDVKGTS